MANEREEDGENYMSQRIEIKQFMLFQLVIKQK